MIQFLEHSSKQYPPRTYENASADATIAFAFDFNTAGEKLTRDAVIAQGKAYISIHPYFSSDDITKTVYILNKVNAKSLNIAGNGLYTTAVKNVHQEDCDDMIHSFLHVLFARNQLKNNIDLIRSGGQTGFDEAGLKAAERLNINNIICLAPKGWRFRDINGNEIYDEKLFKARFGY